MKINVSSPKSEAISDSDLLERLKQADPEKGEYIIRAFHDSEGYWVWFPDEISTYEPGTHTLHEYSVSDLLRAYKKSKIATKKGESIYDSFSDYIDAVVDVLVWKLGYGPETAHAFACDDFKDITRAGFADGKSAKDTAAAIDARYMDGSDGSDEAFDKVLTK